MFSYLDIITTISSIMLIRANTEESLQKKKELLEYIRTENKQVLQKTASQSFWKSHEPSGKKWKKKCQWQPTKSARNSMDLTDV